MKIKNEKSGGVSFIYKIKASKLKNFIVSKKQDITMEKLNHKQIKEYEN